MRIEFTIPLPPPPPETHADYPQARKCATARTASERLPFCIRGECDEPALYRFYIYDESHLIRFYVGETIRFATRMGHYCGMTRRLLLLKQGEHSVWLEKHPMRHVHFFLAEALSHPRRVVLEWSVLSRDLNKAKRVAAEHQERNRLQEKYPSAISIGGHGVGNFETNPNRPLVVQWASVHQRLLTKQNRTRGTPC